MSSLSHASPAQSSLLACISLRYGLAGSSERLCRRIAEELESQFAVRILTVWPVEKHGDGTSEVFFDRGIPVRRFFEQNDSVLFSGTSHSPASVSPELERYLSTEHGRYRALVFIGTPVALALRTILSFPAKSLVIPMDDDIPEARNLANLQSPGSDIVFFEKIRSCVQSLRLSAPSLFIRHAIPEVERQIPKVQKIFVDLKLSLKNGVH